MKLNPFGNQSLMGFLGLSAEASSASYLHLDKGVESTFSQFAEDIKSSGIVDLLDSGKICRGFWTRWIDGLRPTV